MPEPIFFPSPKELRKWLQKNYKSEKELLVGFYKKHTGKPSMTWSESVDQALCFGWIDGVRKSIDDQNYLIRFTPRKPRSNWSAINIKKVEELTKLGLMKPAGLAAFALRDEKRSKIYSYEEKSAGLSSEFEKIFRANKTAWKFFQEQAPWYRKVSAAQIMRAVREETRVKRLNELITDSEAGKKIKSLSYNKKA
ncbi:MAG: YdeI/OmpD-associated family protein [Ignavibacteriota bacterium]